MAGGDGLQVSRAADPRRRRARAAGGDPRLDPDPAPRTWARWSPAWSRCRSAAVMVTAVHVEGSWRAAPTCRSWPSWWRRTSHPLQASGGIATVDDLRKLASAGRRRGHPRHGALHREDLDARAVAKEFP